MWEGKEQGLKGTMEGMVMGAVTLKE